ncbi:MAG: glycosyltransferase family 2 protein [Anaerolineae bacterium]|nr:MAG: glycosyltransferase family 2 protein [Anaerolineae bacterium]
MRKGQNPAKFVKSVAKPERITVAVLSYIPFLSGFYAESLDVLKVCLNSLREGADLPFDLLVFDNGSCEEAREYLVAEKEAGRIQYLILSEKNLGKGGAWNIIFGGAPGEIIAYADSDVLFYPGWLSRSVEILETFPNVGMVTSRPFHTNPLLYSSTLKWAKETKEVALSQGKFIPWDIYREFDLSLGQPEAEIRLRYESTDYWMVTYKGVKAFVGASHWQFVAYKSILQRFLPFSMSRPMGQVRQLDERMNAQGYLRLMVPDPLVMNLSNSTKYLEDRYQKSVSKTKTRAKGLKRLLEVPIVKKVLLKVYNSIFDLYYS